MQPYSVKEDSKIQKEGDFLYLDATEVNMAEIKFL
jgi:hypothetical protein